MVQGIDHQIDSTTLPVKPKNNKSTAQTETNLIGTVNGANNFPGGTGGLGSKKFNK